MNNLIKWLRRIANCIDGVPDDRVIATIARIELERDRYQRGLAVLATSFYKDNQHQDYARHVLGDTPLPSPMEALITCHDRANRMELALKSLGFGGHPVSERIGWCCTHPKPSTYAYFRCEFCFSEHLNVGDIPHAETCPITLARAALEEPKL